MSLLTGLKSSLITSAFLLPSLAFADDATPQQQVIAAFKDIDFSMGYTVIAAVVGGIAGFIVFTSVVKRGLGFIRRI